MKAIYSIQKIWHFLSEIGIKPEMSPGTQKIITLTNRLNISGVFIFSFVLFFDLLPSTESYNSHDASIPRFTLLLLLHLSFLFLSHYGYFTITKLLMLITTPFLIIVLPTIQGYVDDEYFLWYHYAPLAFSVIPYFVFKTSKEKKYIFLTLVFYFALLLTIDRAIMHFASHPVAIMPIIEANYFYYKLTAIIFFLFINASLYYSFRLSDKYSQELERKNKDLIALNATKDKFFRLIGHDLKNPMGTTIGYMDLLEKHIDKFDKEKIIEIVTSIKSSSQRGFQLLEELLEWAKSQTGNIAFAPEPIQLSSIINRNIEWLSENANFKEIKIHKNIDDKLYIMADKYMLNTIVRNLLSNAIKFTHTSGQINISSSTNQQWVTISVEDNGMGMTDAQIESLFKTQSKFETRTGTDNEKGTGLGLVITQEFVLRHQGKIWVKKNTDQGCKFSFTVPLVATLQM